MDRFFKALLFTGTILGLALIVFPVTAQIEQITDCGDELGIPCGAAPLNDPAEPFGRYVINIVNAFLTLAAILAVIFIIYGGVQYIFSAGDDRKASNAKTTILYAIIGLIIIALAVSIVQFTSRAIGIAGSNSSQPAGGEE